jgi:hypothetical protein
MGVAFDFGYDLRRPSTYLCFLEEGCIMNTVHAPLKSSWSIYHAVVYTLPTGNKIKVASKYNLVLLLAF